MKRFISKKAVAIGLAVGLGLGFAGTALAYWSSSGNGTGSAATGTQSSDLAFSNNSITNLRPGGAAEDLTVTVTNDSTTNTAFVAGVKAYLTVTEGTPGSSVIGYTCSSADYYLDGVAGTSATNTVALDWNGTELALNGASGDAASSVGDDTIQFNDLATTDQDACQGATVTINYISS